MAMSPSSLLARLDELKKWQQIQQERLLKQHHLRLEETNRDGSCSDYETIPELSEYDSTVNEDSYDEPKNNNMDIVQIIDTKINPNVVKSIPTIIRQDETESLKQDLLVRDKTISKKPFLRRGEGLAKFGMKAGDQNRPFNKFKVPKTIIHQRLSMLRKSKTLGNNVSSNEDNSAEFDEKCPRAVFSKEKSETKKNVSESSITPLKMPDINIQPKAKWCSIDDNTEQLKEKQTARSNNEVITTINEIASQNYSTEDKNSVSPTNVISSDLLQYLKQLATQKFGNVQEINMQMETHKTKYGEQTLYEIALEKELKNFEQLEEKVLQSSFCSTNSSVVQLLSSTPNKMTPSFETIPEKRTVHFDNIPERKAKKLLDFHEIEIHSNDSSVTSEDLEDRTMENRNWSDHLRSNTEISYDTMSCSSSQSTNSCKVIVKQNAAVMTDDINFYQNIDDTLRMKLADLDIEIAKFRTENNKLRKCKDDFENEKKQFERLKKKQEKDLQDERIKLEFEVEEEKKKLLKEKMVFERYVKDLQNKPSKKEREEISILKTELANVKETLKLKETRNGTTQARLRNQIKSYEKDNFNLKQETEKLQKQNAKLVASQKIARKPSETKMLHEINKNLTKLTQDTKINKQINKMEKAIEKEVDINDSFINLEDNTNKKQNLRRKSYNYETEYQRSFSASNDENARRNSSDKEFINTKEIKRSISDKAENFNDHYKNHENTLSENINSQKENIKNSSDDPKCIQNNNRYSKGKENETNELNSDIMDFQNLSDFSLIRNYERIFGSQQERNNSLNDTQATSVGKIETILKDGSKEVNYPNGNIKIISDDGNNIKMKYFNGDIKETNLLDGSIKYFYLETNVWHTNLADGIEILEFPDGQIEKKFPDGSSEIQFPNGVNKSTQKDGTDRILYPDGSVVTVNAEGEKVLILPNGQKEIHTTEHKRREYPDGTVKILYPDGLQETRYSNGRIRLKDKDGNLIMDSHEN